MYESDNNAEKSYQTQMDETHIERPFGYEEKGWVVSVIKRVADVAIVYSCKTYDEQVYWLL